MKFKQIFQVLGLVLVSVFVTGCGDEEKPPAPSVSSESVDPVEEGQKKWEEEQARKDQEIREEAAKAKKAGQAYVDRVKSYLKNDLGHDLSEIESKSLEEQREGLESKIRSLLRLCHSDRLSDNNKIEENFIKVYPRFKHIVFDDAKMVAMFKILKPKAPLPTGNTLKYDLLKEFLVLQYDTLTDYQSKLAGH